MPRAHLRHGLAILIAVVIDATRVGLVAAEASFVPGISPETVRDAPLDPAVIPLVVLAVAVLTVVVVLRSPSPRRAVGVILGILGMLVGGLFVLAGLFGDLSGRHEIFVVPLAIGLVALGVSLYGIWRVTRGHARSASGDRIA
jgi:hypothetical protein